MDEVAVLRHRATAPLVVGLGAFAISLIAITVPSIWYDEAATIVSATRSWPQLWAELGNVDAVHGLYYAIMHLVFDAVGYSPLSLRLPSAIAIGGTGALVVLIARRLGTERFAWLAGLLFCLLPSTIWAGGEGRSYAITALLAAALTLCFLLAVAHRSRFLWALYGLLTVVAVLMFIYLALIVVAHGVTVVWWALARRPGWAATLRGWLISAGLAGALLVPFGLVAVAQSSQVAWIPPLGIATVDSVIRWQWFEANIPYAIAGWIVIAAGAVLLLRPPRRLTAGALVLPGLVVPTFGLLLASLLITPTYTPRYLTMCIPFVALVMAAAITELRGRRTVIAIALAVILTIPSVIVLRAPAAKDASNWDQVASYVAAQRAADGPAAVTGIIYGTIPRHPGSTARAIEYAYPAEFVGTVDLTLRTPAADTGTLWDASYPLADSVGRLKGVSVVLLITGTSPDIRPATIQTLARAGWRLVHTQSLAEVKVLRFERG